MAVRYTEEQLNTVDKSLLIQMFLNQQEQLQTLTAEVCSLNEKMQLMMEQMVLANRNRFGRSSEKWRMPVRSASGKWMELLFSSMRQRQSVTWMPRSRSTWRSLLPVR